MADLVIPPGFGLMQLQLQHATIAHTAVCTFGFSIAAPPYTQSNNDANLAALRVSLLGLYDNEVTFQRLVTLVGNDGPLLRVESAGTGQGTRAAVVITSPNTTYLLKRTTGFAGRRYRGRLYLPFVNTLGITQTGQLSAGELTLLTSAAAALRSNIEGVPAGNVAQYALLHSTSPLSSTPPPTTVTALTAEAFVATQRRRLERS
jgi:hypothetical protein